MHGITRFLQIDFAGNTAEKTRHVSSGSFRSPKHNTFIHHEALGFVVLRIWVLCTMDSFRMSEAWFDSAKNSVA
jgi:hypothetical protein